MNIEKSAIREFCHQVKRKFRFESLDRGPYDEADLVQDLTQFLEAQTTVLGSAVGDRADACAYPAWSERRELGLTVREHYAAMALAGMLALEGGAPELLAELAIGYADALLKVLEKK